MHHVLKFVICCWIAVLTTQHTTTPTPTPTPPTTTSTQTIHQTRNVRDEVVSFRVHGYNYDFIKRAVVKVDDFLHAASVTVTQTQASFRVGLEDSSSMQQAQQLMFTQLISQPLIGGVIVILHDSGRVAGYARGSNALLGSSITMFFDVLCSEFSSANTTSVCLASFLVDERGNPTMLIGLSDINDTSPVISRHIQAATNNTNASWSKLTAEDNTNAGVDFAAPLTNAASGSFLGITSVFMASSNIDSFLSSNFATNVTSNRDWNERVVFIMDDYGDLVGASVPGVAYTLNELGFQKAVNVVNCSNYLIRSAGLFVFEFITDQRATDEYVLYLFNNLIIQSTLIERPGLRWHIISAYPYTLTPDYPTTSSLSFVVVTAVCSFIFFCNVLTAWWIVTHNHFRLWRFAQPNWLLALLASASLCLAICMNAMTTPSQEKCTSSVWITTTALSVTCAAILGKAEVMAHEALTFESAMHVPQIRRRLAYIAIVLVIQCTLLLVQTFLDQGFIETSIVDTTSQLAIRRACTYTLPSLRIARHAIVACLSAAAVIKTWIVRDASVICEESRGLLIAAVTAACMTGALIGFDLGASAHDSSAGMSLMPVMIVLWYAITLLLFVFAPRLYRHVRIGDLTAAEMRELLVRLDRKRNGGGGKAMGVRPNVVGGGVGGFGFGYGGGGGGGLGVCGVTVGERYLSRDISTFTTAAQASWQY